jgi:hypothetical protein
MNGNSDVAIFLIDKKGARRTRLRPLPLLQASKAQRVYKPSTLIYQDDASPTFWALFF